MGFALLGGEGCFQGEGNALLRADLKKLRLLTLESHSVLQSRYQRIL